MLNSKAVFHRNISQANDLGALYAHLNAVVPIPEQFDGLLRFQIVDAVSSFDKLMHDLIRIGMVQIFEKMRPPTAKYLNESIAIQNFPGLAVGSVPPPSVRFEEIVREKLSILSFQDPIKVVDGLSYIWNEKQKWHVIAKGMGSTDEVIKRKLKLIVVRRNAIVHEADLDPVTNKKQAIDPIESTDISEFLLALGNRVSELVT
ncbi:MULTISPECIES: HEPN domain-containing protein [Xanthomonas]|uniref:HEPN domain-containing protein n=1 Tax=Xanthomonas TaxID=338 RepID=UPI0015D6368D|nr:MULTISPECIES: HEPN domain-containing protein [Xanthomonas]MCE4359641.1 hypothetical protein [Xanthomonas hortorum pv. taraxaci]MEA9761298.1 HEPN domain-containing protein [Xanthomonas campestris pv. raphani]NMI53168.1 hypothetical protein [Xanthomonas hortorum pv. taraxaci]CAD0299346.1 hypothetical protein NCPPB940_01620 [Xanthomonas hortorum pv. taraxaci]CAD0299351.1 hypothetical protein NCPPB940_01620 [Xanthomonas hortorum pv. taraxaci]